MANYNDLLPEQLARVKIDKQLMETGWEVVSRGGIIKFTTINLLSLTACQLILQNSLPVQLK